MSQRVWRGVILAVALSVVPSLAFADGLFTVFIGSASFTTDKATASESALTYGGNLTFKSKTIGVDVDFGYSNNIGGHDIATANARTFAVNLIVNAGPRQGRIQPYVSGGGGLLGYPLATFSDVFASSQKKNDAVIDVGGGVLVSASGRLGARADVRYFRDVTPINGTPTISFWRIAGGLTIGF